MKRKPDKIKKKNKKNENKKTKEKNVRLQNDPSWGRNIEQGQGGGVWVPLLRSEPWTLTSGVTHVGEVMGY